MVPVSRRPHAAVPPRARDRFERSTPIAARCLSLQLSSAAPPPASAAAAAAVPRHRRRLRHLFAPDEHLRRTTLRARLSTPSTPCIAPPGCAPLTADISPRARRIQARREHPQRYVPQLSTFSWSHHARCSKGDSYPGPLNHISTLPTLNEKFHRPILFPVSKIQLRCPIKPFLYPCKHQDSNIQDQ
jgi:hypothetical protein